MRQYLSRYRLLLFSMLTLMLNGCTYYATPSEKYGARLPQKVETNEKLVLVDPNVHAWGAYNSNGDLVRAGVATAGGEFCEDTGRPCQTGSGTFRISSLGDENCISSVYPLPEGGGLMPYCMSPP